jgi:type IV secretion system protein VirB10
MDSNAPKEENTGLGSKIANMIPKVGVELSKVAANPKQGMAIIAAIILASSYMVWGIIKEEDEVKQNMNKVEKVESPKLVVKPSAEMNIQQDPAIRDLPKAPTLADPIAPPPPVVAVAIPKAVADNKPMPPTLTPPKPQPIIPPVNSKPAPLPTPKTNSVLPLPQNIPSDSGKISKSVIPKVVIDPEKKKQKQQRQKSSIVLIGGAPPKSEEKIEQDTLFKKRSNLEFTLGKGKIIDAVIESAINTDFPNEVRAVISRDIYSESGQVILIPKGSRIFGTFDSGVESNYARVNIVWNRVDLPTGYSLTLEGTGIDALGRKGSEGRLDNKVKEKITNSVLTTAVNIAFAGALDHFVKPENKGTQATQGMAVASNLQQAVQAAYGGPTQGREKITAMCTAATNAVPDPSNPAFNKIQVACANANASTGDVDQTVAALFSSLMSAANTSIAQTVSSSTPTKQQEATKKGMENFSKTMEDIVKQATPKPTITIDQGTAVKIYVSRDYKFPRDAVNSSRVIQ